ncbi:MAG: hypothetical protein QW051_01915 [Candidatus Aenigmatarchaeota archaeon]
MENEKIVFLVIFLIFLSLIFVMATTDLTGNIIMDAKSSTSPVIGSIIIVIFIVSVILVFKSILKEGA